MSAHSELCPSNEGQFLYRGRWVDKTHFRARVYGVDMRMVADSYEDYLALIATGVWFDEPPKKEVKHATAKPKRKKVCK